MKKLLIIALITGALAACGDNRTNEERINNSADSTMPATTDTSRMNTDTTGRQNPNQNQDSLRY